MTFKDFLKWDEKHKRECNDNTYYQNNIVKHALSVQRTEIILHLHSLRRFISQADDTAK